MKIFGKELKFNGFDIWHKGNFTPSKVATSNNYNDLDNKPSSLPANGGNADTATKLQTVRKINGVNFDGSSDITITANPNLHNHDMSNISTGNLLTDRLSEPPYVIGSITKTARPLFDVLRADRTSFLPETQIIIESSIDGGTTWVDAQVSDSNKRKLFTGQRPSISIPLKNGVKSTDCMIRITITGMRYNVPDGTLETEKYNYWNSTYIKSTERYFSAQEGWTWVSSNSDRIYMKVERATGGNSTSWGIDREAYLTGWSGGNYFSLSGSTFGGGTTQTANYWNWRFTFRTCSSKNTFNDADLSTSYTTSAQAIHHIKISGANVWSTPNNYMYHDHLYAWDEFQNAIFPSEIKAVTFKNSSGSEVSYSGHKHTKLEITDFPSLSIVATSGNYDDLSNKPTIPIKTSQLTNDSDYVKSTGSITGNAGTATKLQTARKINGVNFDGSADITIADSTKANINSPTFTGTPKSPTPATNDNSTNVATTAFVKAQGYITSAQAGTIVTISNTIPSSPKAGDIWIQTF